jgi:hypothetical protein
MASQIVFDITGGETQFQTMTLATIPNKAPATQAEHVSFLVRHDDIEGARYIPPKQIERTNFLDVSDIAGAVTKPMVRADRTPFI